MTPNDKEPDGGDIKVTMDDTTQLTIDGQPGKNKDLIMGETVDVTLATNCNTAVAMINVASNKKKS